MELELRVTGKHKIHPHKFLNKLPKGIFIGTWYVLFRWYVLPLLMHLEDTIRLNGQMIDLIT